MRCPACDNEMLVLEYNKIEMDFCGGCGGVWLDEGELELLISSESGSSSAISGLVSDLKMAKTTDGSRKCPVCGKKLVPTALNMEPPVEIERCPLNQGLWFDRGELEQIMAASGAGDKLADYLRSVFKK